MRLSLLLFSGLLYLACNTPPAHAQALADTVFTWQGYGQSAQCRVLVYATPPREDRPYAIIVQELAENDGPSTARDARYLAERIGRAFSIEPSSAYWILHWGSFSFEGASPDAEKELFIRATFRRIKSGSLASPSWRVLSREEVEELTDRQFD